MLDHGFSGKVVYRATVQRASGAGCAVSADTFSECMSRAISEATYYMIFCEYADISIALSVECLECEGKGVVRLKHRTHYADGTPREFRDCPHCNGKGVVDFDAFDVALDPQADDTIRDMRRACAPVSPVAA